ncbi:MAG TPA: PQQ-binding-like beta-propeller repeat protein [Planctomycetota bacterium]
MTLLWLLLQAATDDGVRAQLERLSSADVEVRQAAEAALVAMGEDVIAPLERLAATADVETRGRVADVVRRLRWWDHVVFFRGRKIDLRRGSAQATDYGPHARVVGGRIVDVTATSIRAFDLRSGRALWKTEPVGELWGVEAGESSIAIRTPKGVTCLDAADGRALWTSPAHRFEPLAGGDWLVADGDGLARKGSTPWAVKAGQPCFVAAAGPWALATGPAGHSRLLDARTGKELRTLDNAAYRAVQAGDDRLLVVGRRTLTAYKPSDGSIFWTRLEVGEASRPLVEGRRVYVADHIAMCCGIKLYALDVETSETLWTAQARGIPTEHSKYRHDARLARVGPYLVLTGEAAAGDYVEAFDSATGATVSRWTSP